MAPPTTLAIKTGSVTRLIKEEAMYHRELATEQSRLAKLEAPGSDADEYAIKQQVRVAAAVSPPALTPAHRPRSSRRPTPSSSTSRKRLRPPSRRSSTRS